MDELPMEVLAKGVGPHLDILSALCFALTCKKALRITQYVETNLNRRKLQYQNICTEAAIIGYLDVLKWARENGCPWNE